MDDVYLRSTKLLDFQAPSIEALVMQRGWRDLPLFERIGSAYPYVRDEIPLGYNESDRLAASRVLRDGYGQCNTKATLLMALLRSVGVECRLHGSTVHKRLQKGVVTGVFYALAPMRILHSESEKPSFSPQTSTSMHARIESHRPEGCVAARGAY